MIELLKSDIEDTIETAYTKTSDSHSEVIHFNFSDLDVGGYITVIVFCLVIVYGAIFYLKLSLKYPSLRAIFHIFQTAYSDQIWQYLNDNTQDAKGKRYKSIEEIADACSITHLQARRACFSNPHIYQSKDTRKEMWTIYPDESSRETPYYR